MIESGPLFGFPFRIEPVFTGGSDGTGRLGTIIVSDSVAGRTGTAPWNWGSPHIAGAQFVFADGAVRTIPFGTDGAVVSALLTPAGREVVSGSDY